ncbi:peptidase family M13, partial [Ostertagia ostertagi]
NGGGLPIRNTSKIPPKETLELRNSILKLLQLCDNIVDADQNQKFQTDPCVDFFEFTCGKWISAHPIPEYKTSITQLEVLSDKVEEQMRESSEILVSASIRKTKAPVPSLGAFESPEISSSNAVNALKSMYRKCMDKKELTSIGSTQLLQAIRNYGVWPMVDGDDKWRAREFDLTSLLIYVSETRDINVFIANYVALDDKNASRRLIKFDQADLGLGANTRDYYLDRAKHEKKIAAYKHLLIRRVKLIYEYANLPSNDEKITSDVDELIELETKIARIMVAEEDRRDHFERYNLRRLSDMEKLTPMIDWSRYFLSIAPLPLHEYFAADPEILILTDPRTTTNYIFIRFLSAWDGELGERFEDVFQEFELLMYGRKQKSPRWKRCTHDTVERMQHAAGAIYVSKFFNKASKNVTLDMVDDLRAAFKEMLIEVNWMDETTRKTAFGKIQEMLSLIAYPPFILDSKELDNHYNNFSVKDSDSYSQMVEKTSRFDIEFDFKRLIEPVDRSEYDFNAVVVDAYYSPHSNTFQPLFCNRRSFIMPFQKRSTTEELEPLLDMKLLTDLMMKAMTFVPGTDLNLNGKLTQGENIADNGGVKQAFRAYKRFLKKHGEEKRIEGLEQYSNEQIFFMGFAMVHCGHTTQDELIDTILTDNHSPERYRINQVLANQPEFATAFNCAVGTPMNPTHRCAVW